MIEKKAIDLEEDRLLLGGIIRELLIIGEAANSVSESLQNELPSIPWRQVIGMRNHLVHAYFEINLKILWMTATEDIPRLVEAINKVLNLPEHFEQEF